MSKIIVAGRAVVLESTMKLEDIQFIKKYRHEALTLMGGEDGKDPIFSIDAGEGTGDINQYGAKFCDKNAAGYASITLMPEIHGEDIKAAVADRFGGALVNLNKLEQVLPSVLEEIKAEREAIMGTISVFGDETPADGQ